MYVNYFRVDAEGSVSMDTGRDYCKPPMPILHLRVEGQEKRPGEPVNWQLGCIPVVALDCIKPIFGREPSYSVNQALAVNPLI